MKEKAKLAGCALAHAIADRQALGQRPVVLCGHSMGARLIFYCLQVLKRVVSIFITTTLNIMIPLTQSIIFPILHVAHHDKSHGRSSIQTGSTS